MLLVCVMPADAGIQRGTRLDSGIRRNDGMAVRAIDQKCASANIVLCVMPADAGIQRGTRLDSGIRRNDGMAVRAIDQKCASANIVLCVMPAYAGVPDAAAALGWKTGIQRGTRLDSGIRRNDGMLMRAIRQKSAAAIIVTP